ncbi:capsular biosynthesis protein [Paenibacillus chitinolyticus]|uniref:tyrosine-protein phosphatase n=1 Tax=Paenibacillus chitinolyticus TaxID=79263 RepID=UPI002DB7C2DD|nr:CpsB/CapC family capsule biosynthesis tyrosine phosphatase [Paenibacillus chitinolyticus]MEC0247476.1 capsular biosynthesis protein [Paenibacillus chitinolyticus]
MYTDLHCHILPGLDDGAPDLEAALTMAEHAAASGISRVVATPHHGGAYDNEAPAVREAVELLQQALDRRGIALTVLPGHEIRVYDRLLDDLLDGRLCTLGGSRYLLLELPGGRVPGGFAELLHELGVRGIVPILAHPERSGEIQRRPELLREWMDGGLLLQVTAGALTGMYGRRMQAFALSLCRANAVHFLASDAHDVVVRKWHLADAYALAARKVGPEQVSAYRANAEYVARDEVIVPAVPAHNMSLSRALWPWPFNIRVKG